MAIKGKENKMVQASNYLDGRIGRTKVGRHFKWRTTFNSGYLIPFWCDEVYPAQNKKVDCGELVRSIVPLGPTMDNSFLDLFFFFVPFRLLWDHWEEFIAGYNKEAWTQDVVYTVPQIKFKSVDAGGSENYFHSFYDYLPGLGNPEDLLLAQRYAGAGADAAAIAEREAEVDAVFGFSALYPRAFVKIYNDWFRDENLQDELQLYTGDNDEYADEFAFDLLDPTKLPKLAKYHNRFTSCLPQPQKGPDVLIPMSDLTLRFDGVSNLSQYWTDDNSLIFGSKFGDVAGLVTGDSDPHALLASNVSNTIRQLRLATQTELLLARDARGGTRYVESLLSHFGVHNGDARLQRAEYLGSKQIPLQVMQVTNTAASIGNPLGSVGGQSVTKDNSHFFIKGFSEHGVVFCVGGVRTNISYSHGQRKIYARKNRFDFIWPEFRHIGDVPCYTKELVQLVGSKATAASDPTYAPVDNDRVFGYTPYGSEMRDGYNFNNGLFRDNASGSLAYLTYQEAYGFYRTGVGTAQTNLPTLSDKWIQQDSGIIGATLVSAEAPQFYALFDLYSEDVIPLDPTSDPGLMDHF